MLMPALLIFFALTSPQNQLPVKFALNPSRNTQIGSLIRNGTTYVSLGDLARVFKLNAVPDPATHKIEIQGEQFTVRVSDDNPFVIISDKKENANLLQLPANVVYSANSFYVPIDAFIPVLKIILSEDITYDRSMIIVGHPMPASSFDVTGLVFDQKTNGSLVRIRCTKKLTDYESWLKPVGEDSWLYITLANARADVSAIRKIKAAGDVKKILVFQSPTSVQLTLRLKGQVRSAEVIPAENGNDILVAIHYPTEEQLASRKTRDYEQALKRERDRWKLDVVVIDPGHGGDDPGTIGFKKTKEKEITLAIGLKLGKLIEKNLPGVKVVYTRKTDKFIELYRRGQIANQSNGKLFISIHCNSMPHKPNPANGFEIYLLRPGKTESAIRIAERENAVVKYEEGYEKRYQELTEENFILLTMAQSAYVKYSEQFASILQQEFHKNAEVADNGVKQAGFYVLVGTSMPNLLVETAYLSNKHDEKILRSSPGQQRIANSIFKAIKRYKLEYEKTLKEGVEPGAGTR